MPSPLCHRPVSWTRARLSPRISNRLITTTPSRPLSLTPPPPLPVIHCKHNLNPPNHTRQQHPQRSAPQPVHNDSRPLFTDNKGQTSESHKQVEALVLSWNRVLPNVFHPKPTLATTPFLPAPAIPVRHPIFPISRNSLHPNPLRTHQKPSHPPRSASPSLHPLPAIPHPRHRPQPSIRRRISHL